MESQERKFSQDVYQCQCCKTIFPFNGGGRVILLDKCGVKDAHFILVGRQGVDSKINTDHICEER